MTFNEEPRDPRKAASPKKCWKAPRLQRYGTLVNVTETIIGMGFPDGGGALAMMHNRTR